jgi:hypothetical protein
MSRWRWWLEVVAGGGGGGGDCPGRLFRAVVQRMLSSAPVNQSYYYVLYRRNASRITDYFFILLYAGMFSFQKTD